MKTFTNAQVLNVIKPHFEAHLQGLPHLKVSLVESGDQLLLEYENVISNSYILPQIKLEFGARNAVEPSAVHLIQPDVLTWEVSKQLEFPSVKVPVLLAERTYWEKVTLIQLAFLCTARDMVGIISSLNQDLSGYANRIAGGLLDGAVTATVDFFI
jgi:hypothetical protein